VHASQRAVTALVTHSGVAAAHAHVWLSGAHSTVVWEATRCAMCWSLFVHTDVIICSNDVSYLSCEQPDRIVSVVCSVEGNRCPCAIVCWLSTKLLNACSFRKYFSVAWFVLSLLSSFCLSRSVIRSASRSASMPAISHMSSSSGSSSMALCATLLLFDAVNTLCSICLTT